MNPMLRTYKISGDLTKQIGFCHRRSFVARNDNHGVRKSRRIHNYLYSLFEYAYIIYEVLTTSTWYLKHSLPRNVIAYAWPRYLLLQSRYPYNNIEYLRLRLDQFRGICSSIYTHGKRTTQHLGLGLGFLNSQSAFWVFVSSVLFPLRLFQITCRSSTHSLGTMCLHLFTFFLCKEK